MNKYQASIRKGFTLIELLAAISIIAILVTLIIPTISKIKKTSDSTRCLSNLRTIQFAMIQHSTENNGNLLRWVHAGYWFDNLIWGEYLPAPTQKQNPFECESNEINTFAMTVNGIKYPMQYAINSVDKNHSYDGRYGPSYTSRVDRDEEGNATYVPNKNIAIENPAQTIGICDGNTWLVRNNYANVGIGVHSGAMNAAFWDGHVEQIPEEELTVIEDFPVPVLPTNDIRFAITKSAR
ncbi:prepilin-type N-terminal cleavage/methylation domain-containing protein [Coraliomargarita algicola]|uniref:Prepilin-type N-terminal cleavage/methylation domain-containing protein n=1 Tax=Coraliomargarita algicola TaxID=3092156 RepID=A0ABZ0RJ14_9BACT|nr:prepilin-type N-terminal cleavage/methylation domain-containing protein [Coraliomargarita sp. J2-16]WPJ95053.1 prepilin-type N-terminal cleavage/methylation domain-containing protein [Coraliomargarita sp. J2-16]